MLVPRPLASSYEFEIYTNKNMNGSSVDDGAGSGQLPGHWYLRYQYLIFIDTRERL